MDTPTDAEIVPEILEPTEPAPESTPAPTAVITEEGLIQQIDTISEPTLIPETSAIVEETAAVINAEETAAVTISEEMEVATVTAEENKLIPDITGDLNERTEESATEIELNLQLEGETEDAQPVQMDMSAEECMLEHQEPHEAMEVPEATIEPLQGSIKQEVQIIHEELAGDIPIYEEHVSSDSTQQEPESLPETIHEEVEVREEVVKEVGKSEEGNSGKNVKTTTIKNGKAIIEFDDASQESGTVVVVTADGSTKELLLRSSDVQNLEEGSSVTVQQVTDENGQVYYVETMDNVIVMEEEEDEHLERLSEELVDEHGEPIDTVPVNIRGRTLENPSLDPLKNGKPPPKPRLGVKVPHRHLTSQIVSKQEIANEIIERSWKCAKYPTMQNIFAQKMTKTLAKKLNSTKKPTPEKPPAKVKPNPTEKKLNNSDLIAILEGNSEPEMEQETIVVPPPVKPAVMTRELEREIALRQLSELPDDPPETKNDIPVKPEKSISDDPGLKKKRKAHDDTDDEIPKNRFSANVPLKTYTRKRKPSDEMSAPNEKVTTVPKTNSEDITAESTKKIDLPSNTSNNYITKSSRIIKKKIIWDPDEVSPKKMMKLESVSPGKERVSVLTIKNDKDSNEKKEKKETVAEIKKPDVKKIISGTTKVDILKSEKRIVVKSKDVKPKTGDSKSPNDKLAAALKFKKRLTEVDKLLMDEGAVNMLYSFKTTEEDQTKKKHNKSLVSKTNELLNDLQTSMEKVSPKALRKKEAVQAVAVVKSTPKKIGSPAPSSVAARQKSKDSNRSSGHSPPPSPASFTADASRIFRRHSSSSFSSGAEGEDEEGVMKSPKVRKAEKRLKKKLDAPEGQSKKIKKEKIEQKDETKEKDRKNQEMSKTFNKLMNLEPEQVPRYDKYKLLTVLKFDQLMQINIKPNKNEEFYFNIGVMHELTSLLKELETDECNMVLLTSSAKKSFTCGTNFKIVTAQKEATKKNLAKRLATSVRDLLLTLANFSKVIVAGVHGKVIGLGVTMLPLFDIVIAHESASFSTPYVELGCMAEGGSLLSLPHLSQNILVSELLYSAQVLKADAALRLGLITRIITDSEFQEGLPTLLRDMSNQSTQFMEATKKQIRQRMIPDITANLNSETEALVQQWISPECQNNFLQKFGA